MARTKNTAHEEVSAAIFSLCDFSWREVRLRAAPSFPTKKSTGQLEATPRASERAGGFRYDESALNYSSCRNRFILWHYFEGRLKLLEISLDVPLAHNALELVLDGVDHLLPGVTIHERGESEVMVLFATSTTAYRLVLHHPEKISKTPALYAVGEGVAPSVLAFASEHSFVGSAMAALFNEPSSVVAVTTCSACVNPDGVTTFALASPSGSIPLIQLLPPHEQGLSGPPTRSVLRETSMMTKLLSSFLPVVGRGGGGGAISEDAPVSILLHVFGGQPVVIALCADLNLRLWSVQLAQCVITHSLSQYVLCSSAGLKADQLLLMGAPDSSSTSLKFAVHLHTEASSQISIFEIHYIDDQLHLQQVHTYRCPQDGELVHFFLSEREVWGLWVWPGQDGEGDTVSLKQAVYDQPMTSTWWRDVLLCPLPSKEPVVLPQQEPREFFKDAIFCPGSFSSQAISKALELYGGRGLGTLREMEEEATRRVEHEVQATASTLEMDSDEYRQLSIKCWSKFYACCREYQELSCRPLAVFQDTVTGMGVLIKQGMVSFLQPAELSESDDGVEFSLLPASVQDNVLRCDVETFLCCMRNTLKQASPDLLNSFNMELSCHGNPNATPPIKLAQELANVIHDESWDFNVYSDLCCVRDMSAILSALLEALDPMEEGVEGGVAEEMDEEEDVYGEHSKLQTATSQLFKAPLAMTLLSSAFQGVCRLRLSLCRDILIMLHVLKRGEAAELLSRVKKPYDVLFSRLVCCYYSLYWFSSHVATPTPLPVDTNLRQFAAMAISGGRGQQGASPPCPTLPLLYLSTRGHEELTVQMAGEKVLSQDKEPHTHWTVLMPMMTKLMIKTLWPRTAACEVAGFLLDNGQYNHLQTFVTLAIANHALPCGHSLFFLLGRSFVCTGELDKAYHFFMRAFEGIDSEKNPMLQHLVEWEESDREGGVTRYFEMAMRMFEQVPSPQYVIKIAESALLMLEKGHPKSTIFWSNLFKHHLALGHAQEAYIAMTSNPDITLRLDCLRRLVVVLTEQKKVRELCQFDYSGMEKEIEEVIETRARSVDVTKCNYYDVLYCYHTHRCNFRKGAYVMYECGMRLGREASGVSALKKQCDCYSMCILALHLTDPKYAWVVRPVQERTTTSRRSHRKRTRVQGKGRPKQPLEVLTADEIGKDYVLVRAKLNLLQKEPSLTTQLSSPFVSAEEVSALLVQAGMFEDALNLSQRLHLPLTTIFEGLASKCIHLSANLVDYGQQLSDKAGWEWLGRNEGLNIQRTRENSIADKAWSMLRTALGRLCGDECAMMYKCVAKKLLSMGKDLPQWMLDTYKKINPAELLKLYLTFDLLEAAISLAMEYIDGVMGHGKEFFGLEDALHASSPSVWLPHTTLSHLRVALAEAPPNSTLQELLSAYDLKLAEYLRQVGVVTSNLEHFGRQEVLVT